MDKKELENFLYYMLDKIQDVYKEEVKTAIERFLQEYNK